MLLFSNLQYFIMSCKIERCIIILGDWLVDNTVFPYIIQQIITKLLTKLCYFFK